MTQKELIRQESERLKNIAENNNASEYLRGQARVCRVLLDFIDSLPEEKPSEDLEEAARLYAIPHYMRDVDVNYLEEYSYDKIAEAAFIAGAEWQANQLLKGSPLPEDTVLFQKGVEEGRRLEKDEHRLTWQDMAKIDAIILDVNNEFAVDYSKEISRQKFYEEVLKRYNETKR